jgi:aminoglycoside phosphotransferase (APT) family kinase protein
VTTARSWQELAERFSLGSVRGTPAYVTRGAMGEIWQLDTADGRWAVKWQFRWAPTDARPPDVPIQLAAADAGIPLPRPRVAPAGAAVLAVGGRHARVYEWVDLGRPLAPPVSAAAAAEAGRLLGVLHRLSIPAHEPADPWYTAAPSADRWTDLVERAAATGAAWAAQLKAARGLIADLTEFAIPASQPPVACHRDFNPDNVLPALPDGHLTVLDWENAGRLDPRRELGYALFAWSTGRGRIDAAAADALAAGYSAACGTTPDLGAGLYATAVATHLNILRVMAERSLEDPDDRSYADEAVLGLLNDDLGDLSRVVGLNSHRKDAS